jgi:UPF0716 protein FxsA
MQPYIGHLRQGPSTIRHKELRLLRYLPSILFAVFILELASLIWLGGHLGVSPVVALTILDIMIGSALLRRSGTSIFSALNSRNPDAKAVSSGAANGMLNATSGLLFIIPGLFSDMLALFLLLPWLRKKLAKSFESHISTGMAYGGARRGTVIDAEGVEIIDPPKLIEDSTRD